MKLCLQLDMRVLEFVLSAICRKLPMVESTGPFHYVCHRFVYHILLTPVFSLCLIRLSQHSAFCSQPIQDSLAFARVINELTSSGFVHLLQQHQRHLCPHTSRWTKLPTDQKSVLEHVWRNGWSTMRLQEAVQSHLSFWEICPGPPKVEPPLPNS